MDETKGVSRVTDIEKVEESLKAIRMCVLGMGCNDCPYRSEDECKFEMLQDAKNEVESYKTFRRHMFNRCAAQTHCETCEICVWFEQCEKERTLNPL